MTLKIVCEEMIEINHSNRDIENQITIGNYKAQTKRVKPKVYLYVDKCFYILIGFT